jgi:hypothetical protein
MVKDFGNEIKITKNLQQQNNASHLLGQREQFRGKRVIFIR